MPRGRDQWFESCSLQRRVQCEPDFRSSGWKAGPTFRSGGDRKDQAQRPALDPRVKLGHDKNAVYQLAADAHAVVILDRAGWHRSQGLVVPGNITLLELPPYSPELNPVERIWHYLRSHWLANSVFISLADIMDACEMAWNRFATNHDLIRSLCAVAWAPASLAL
jgi:hypothetical protein